MKELGTEGPCESGEGICSSCAAAYEYAKIKIDCSYDVGFVFGYVRDAVWGEEKSKPLFAFKPDAGKCGGDKIDRGRMPRGDDLDVKRKVESLCKGKEICEFTPSRGLFGTIQANSPSSLTVIAQCVHEGNFKASELNKTKALMKAGCDGSGGCHTCAQFIPPTPVTNSKNEDGTENKTLSLGSATMFRAYCPNDQIIQVRARGGGGSLLPSTSRLRCVDSRARGF